MRLRGKALSDWAQKEHEKIVADLQRKRNPAPEPSVEVHAETIIDSNGCKFEPKRQINFNRRGDPAEKTPERIAKRKEQMWAVLQAFLDKPSGYADYQLNASKIGGADGGRARRKLREQYEIDFTQTHVNGVSVWSLTNPDHARKVLAYKAKVEKEL